MHIKLDCVKKNIVCCLFLILANSLFALQGNMAGSGKLRVSKTKWFDIIYSEKNEQTAKILYENADLVFEELAATYGTEPDFRLPVVITTTVEQFNAYFSYAPYNHIVIYDTAQIDDLAVFSQTLLSTFTHELTHAFTYNYKSPFYKTLGNIFGDAFALHYLTVTPGMAEGATVSYESSKGEGRLHDSFFLHTIRQAKIENRFPSYFDVQGAASSYPSGSFYNFNGAFAQWLQQKYGMQKYADFWYLCVNYKKMTVRGAFKKAYGFSLVKAWSWFENEFYLPQNLVKNPTEQGYAENIFKTDKQNSRYDNLCSVNNLLFYIDKSCSSVYSLNLLEDKNQKPKKLFTLDYIDYISLSSDGKYLVVGYYDYNYSTVKHRVKIYDLENKYWFTSQSTNYSEASIVKYNQLYYLVSQFYESQKYSILVEKFIFDDKGKIEYLEQYSKAVFDKENVPQSFVDLQNGTFAYIKKASLNFLICINDLDGNVIAEYESPFADMKMRYLTNDMYFTWAKKDTMPRLGRFNLQTCEYELSDTDISGGIFYPSKLENQIVFIGNFYHHNSIFKATQKLLNTTKYQVENKKVLPYEEYVPDSKEETSIPYQNFAYSDYLFKGLLLPVSMLQSSDYISLATQAYDLPLGFTYATTTPWTTQLLQISGGYGVQTNSAAFGIEYTGGTDTSLFSYDLAASTEFDQKGFKQVNENATIQSLLHFGLRSDVQLIANQSFGYGRTSHEEQNQKINNDNTTKYLINSQNVQLLYSNVFFSGPGINEKLGVAFGLVLNHFDVFQEKSILTKQIDVSDLGFAFSYYIPKLIPIDCNYNFTYNLPSRINFQLYTANNAYYNAANINFDTILFGYKVQKSVPVITFFYIDDINLRFKYTGGYSYQTNESKLSSWHFLNTYDYINTIKNQKSLYSSYETLRLDIGLNPNGGIFATNEIKANLYFEVNFSTYEKEKMSFLKPFDFGFSLSF